MISADLRPPHPAGPRVPPEARVADLQLRGRTAPVATRVYWPAPCPASERSSGAAATAATAATDRWTALVLLAAGTEPADRVDALARGLCTYAGVVVMSSLPATGAAAPDTDARDLDAAMRDATTALDWAADHAAELRADPRRLVVAGWASGARLAASMAHQATEQGWPPIARQLLLCPEATVAFAPGSPAGVAPATVVTVGRRGEGGAVGCGAWLRSAGVRVDELRYEGLPPGEPGWTPWTGAADLVMADLARSLQHRLGLPPTAATRFVAPDDGDDQYDRNDEAGAHAGETRSTGGGFV